MLFTGAHYVHTTSGGRFVLHGDANIDSWSLEVHVREGAHRNMHLAPQAYPVFISIPPSCLPNLLPHLVWMISRLVQTEGSAPSLPWGPHHPMAACMLNSIFTFRNRVKIGYATKLKVFRRQEEQ